MRNLLSLGIAALAAVLLAGCNDGTGGSTATMDGSAARGTLIWNPPLRIATLTAADFTAQLNATTSGQQLLAIVSTGTPTPGALPCGVDFHYIQYGTVDGGNGLTGGANVQAPTTASGALMVPTGPVGVCSGPRPILLYSHATQFNRAANIANITDPNNTEGALIAAMFAAYGYIVVAPNYAGYDSSPLPYHPFLNADQQSKEMIDALTAARKALGGIANGTSDNGKLFISGYSQGGHVAMATMRAMQAASIAYTAAAPMSGPYALEALFDAVFAGQVNLGSTVFAPMLSTSYQRAYGNLYASATDATNIYAAPYAATIDAVLPSNTPLSTLIQQGTLPQTALFSLTPPTTGGVNPTLDAFFVANTPPTTPPAQAPLFALGFASTGFLAQNSWRLAYVADAAANPDGAVPTPTAGVPRAAVPPTQPARLDVYNNDLRTAWAPNEPTLLCGGNADPTVYFSVDTLTMQAFWAALPPGAITVLDVDSAVGVSDPFAAAKLGFAQAKAATAAAAGGGAAGQQAVTQAYHGTLVPPFCAAAARGFFSQF